MNKEVDFSEEKEQYFSSGIERIIQNGNTGYLPAFFNSLINEEGIRYTQESFKKIMDDNDVLCNWKVLPLDFQITIRLSPIALFKKWVIQISNRPLIKISEYGTSKMYEREFFFIFIEDQIYLFPITNNLSHERFLYRLYFRESFKEKNITFNTYFNDQRKLIVYKDYYKRKVYTVPFPGKNFIKNKLYSVRISVIKDENVIRYLIFVNGQKITHMVKVGKRSKVLAKLENPSAIVDKIDGIDIKSKAKSKKRRISGDEKLSLADFRREVIDILCKSHQKEFETNKFANVSLGRTHSVPILINLSQKYKNIQIKLFFKSKEEILQIFSGSQLIKTFSVSFSPKSNWLERA